MKKAQVIGSSKSQTLISQFWWCWSGWEICGYLQDDMDWCLYETWKDTTVSSTVSVSLVTVTYLGFLVNDELLQQVRVLDVVAMFTGQQDLQTVQHCDGCCLAPGEMLPPTEDGKLRTPHPPPPPPPPHPPPPPTPHPPTPHPPHPPPPHPPPPHPHPPPPPPPPPPQPPPPPHTHTHTHPTTTPLFWY